MKFNDLNLKYPDNLYADVSVFQEEDSNRCYYFHSKSSGMPSDAADAVENLLSNFFSRREHLNDIILNLYKNNQSPAETAELCGITENELREILYRFFRDILYFPRYTDIFRNGLR